MLCLFAVRHDVRPLKGAQLLRTSAGQQRQHDVRVQPGPFRRDEDAFRLVEDE
ncbi:hypothetical protein [Fodinicola feengrottensis]|uniref:hypothetical protein n=1 Tax=Fodinicola feengrottensis TaxID=435914 RepID=UPI0024433923|nr:hypothetical protein [Fodinicola feengrottensis]